MLSWKDAESQVVPPKHVKKGQKCQDEHEIAETRRAKVWLNAWDPLSLCCYRLLHLPYPHVVSSIHPSILFIFMQTTKQQTQISGVHTHTISHNLFCASFFTVNLGRFFVCGQRLTVKMPPRKHCLVWWRREGRQQDQKEEKEPQTREIDCKLCGNCACHYFVWPFSLLISFRMDCKATISIWSPSFSSLTFSLWFPTWSHANHSL